MAPVLLPQVLRPLLEYSNWRDECNDSSSVTYTRLSSYVRLKNHPCFGFRFSVLVIISRVTRVFYTLTGLDLRVSTQRNAFTELPLPISLCAMYYWFPIKTQNYSSYAGEARLLCLDKARDRLTALGVFFVNCLFFICKLYIRSCLHLFNFFVYWHNSNT